jgi:Tfp pilus assembly protein PilV
MITTSPAAKSARRRRSGFTLTEVMMAATLTVVAVGGTLSTTMMIAKSGYNISNYTDMEAESRKSLELFGQDVRMAQKIVWHDANRITLTIPTNATGGTTTCTYAYDSAAKTFSRTQGGITSVLISGIENCTLAGYKQNGDLADTGGWETIANDTKQLQLSVSSKRSQGSQVINTQKVISARFILRNKRVAS